MGGPAPSLQPMGPTVQHHTGMQQQQVNGYYHHGNVNGAPPPGPPMGPAPGGHPGGAYNIQYPPPPAPGSVDTPSTQITEIISSPGVGNYTGMVSPNGHNTGYMSDAPVGAVNMGRPHNLPIPNYHGYHHGNPTGVVSHMYDNSDPPVGEQVDIRQPPFTTVGGEDLMCGQGKKHLV